MWAIGSTSLAGLLLLGGCAGGQTGQEGPDESVCAAASADTATVVGQNAVTPLGYSADDLLQLTKGPLSGTIRWYRPAAGSRFTLSTSSDVGSARLVRSSDVAHHCPDRLELDVMVALSTEDGVFQETFATTMVASGNGALTEAHFLAYIELAAVSGTYRADPTDVSRLKNPKLQVQAWFVSSFVSSGVSDAGIPSSVHGSAFLTDRDQDFALADWSSGG